MQISYRAWTSQYKPNLIYNRSYLVVNAEGLVRVLDQLVDREGGVVWLNHGIGHFGRGDDGESGHHSVWEFFADLGDQQGTHTSTSAATKGVGDLEALQAVTALGLASNDIKNLVNKLGTLSVVTLGPVVSCKNALLLVLSHYVQCVYLTSTALAEDEVVGTEELPKGTSSNGIHGTGFEVDENSAGHIFVAGCLAGG